MRYLEIRRHTMRTKPGKHLSQAGVSLARLVGQELGPFQKVVTSSLPRAFETAIAMGFAVDERYELLSHMGDAVDAEVDWTGGFTEFSRAVKLGEATARFALALVELYRAIAEALPEAGRALIISHGGIIEAGAVGCLPTAEHQSWGATCDYCEGVLLSYNGERFVDLAVLRLNKENLLKKV